VIATRSRRTFFEALAKAGLPGPTSDAQIGEAFLRLLVLGIDHELVGTATWLTRTLGTAPGDAARRTQRGRRFRAPHETEADEGAP
jgi:hypothetical protein